MTMPTDDHMSKPGTGTARRIEVFTGAGRRREWSPEQKAAILAESYAGTSSVCDTPGGMD
jgi:transposase